MFEAVQTDRTIASPTEIWALWESPARWPEWNQRFERVELEGEPAPGRRLRIKQRRGGTMEFELVAFEPERRLAYEARFPGARLGHEHIVAPEDGGAEVTHRIYVSGPLAGFWALLLGRKRMREAVTSFGTREREIAERR